MVEPAAQRAAVEHLRQIHDSSERRACRLIGMRRSTYRYKAKAKPSDGVRDRICELARQRQRFGYRRLTALLRREGRAVNPKRVHRICREEGLQVPRQRRKRLKRKATELPELTHADERCGAQNAFCAASFQSNHRQCFYARHIDFAALNAARECERQGIHRLGVRTRPPRGRVPVT
jgi:transposase InsO family protein